MADERVLRVFLNLSPLQFVDITIPKEANFIFIMNMWRNQGFIITEKDFIEWKHVVGVREMPIEAPVEEIKAEKARLN